MKKIKLTIIHPTDPRINKVGGAETFIKGMVKYAPENIDIEFVGINSKDSSTPTGKWQTLKLGEKTFRYYPLLVEKDENQKTLVPLSLRFTYALRKAKLNLDDRVIFFNRIEPAILFRHSKSPKFAIIHNDIKQQILQKGVKLPGVKSHFYILF